MVVQPATSLTELYEIDETAWLDVMSDLVRAGRLSDLDLAHLGEYRADMASPNR